MVDSLTLASTVIAGLAPFLTAAGTAAAKKAGESLYLALEKYFKKQSDSDGQKALDNARSDPEVYVSTLTKFLERRAKADEKFRQWLVEQLQSTAPKAIRASGESTVVSGNKNVVATGGSIAIGGDVSDSKIRVG